MSFGIIYILIGIFLYSIENWTDPKNSFIYEYIIGCLMIIVWPVALIYKPRI